MILARMFVGSDNATGLLDIEAIEKRSTTFFPGGLTIFRARGVWRGGSEDCAVIEVMFPGLGQDDYVTFEALGKALKQALHQEAVLVQYIQVEGKML